MPITRHNQQTFHRTLYGPGILETVTCHKREDDQRQGTYRVVKLFDCRWGQITKTGEPIQHDMISDHRRTLHVPVIEMKRTGINYFNPTDRFLDKDGRWWQPESTVPLTNKLIEQHHCVDCLRADPPAE